MHVEPGALYLAKLHFHLKWIKFLLVRIKLAIDLLLAFHGNAGVFFLVEWRTAKWDTPDLQLVRLWSK